MVVVRRRRRRKRSRSSNRLIDRERLYICLLLGYAERQIDRKIEKTNCII